MTSLFIATERFDSSDGDRWDTYVKSARIPNLVEVVSLDSLICPPLLKEIADEDWKHIVREDFRLNYFYHLNYLLDRIKGVTRRNVLGLYRNPDAHIDLAPADGHFVFIGYDLIEEATQISALTNCGGFPKALSNDELNRFGLISEFDRAREIKKMLPKHYATEHHADCEMYAIWRLAE